MQKKALTGALAVALALVAGTALQAQSQYFEAVTNLHPAGYWPLNETVEPPPPFAQSLIASNSGSLGSTADGYYGAWYQPSGPTWYLTNSIVHSPAVTAPFDSSTGIACGAPGQYVIVPRNTNGVANSSITLNPPFTIEAWLKIGTTANALGDIISQGGFVSMDTGGPNATNQFYGGPSVGAWAGVELGQYQDYVFLICQGTNGQSKANELDTSAYNAHLGFQVGSWVHVVASFDGTTESIYTNGQFCASKNIGNNGAGITYVADPTTPLMIGSGSEVSASYGQGFTGTIDDVAIYPEVLPQTSIANHFQAAYGTNATYGANYPSAVLADSPTIYYRLNDPLSATNAGYPSGTFPVANNYGNLGASGNGVYQPGTSPGAAGPAYAGFGAGSKSVAINGWFGAVDVGGGNLPTTLNPTNTSPLTVATWFRGNIADSPGRFQEMIGHGDSSYRIAMGQAAADVHFNPGPGPELQFANPEDEITNGWALNDGNWHMAVGVSDGVNDYLYLDGVLAKSNSTPGGINIVGNTNDLLLGGDSEYTYANFYSANTIRNFDGEVAHVAFWTNALSAAQVQTLFDAADVPPLIHLQPSGVTNNQGQTVTLTTKFTGSSLHYQWYINGALIGGQTNATLVLDSPTFTNTGAYYVVASNPYGSVTSSVAQVDVVGAPSIQAQSQANLEIYAGVSPTLFVDASGPSLQYQWLSNGVEIAGATSSTFTISDIQAASTYNVEVYNSVGTNLGTPIQVTIAARPTAPYPLAVLADDPIAFYRLDETSGAVAHDYVGGYDGIYTNVNLNDTTDGSYTSGSSTANTDPTDFSAQFGVVSTNNSYVGEIPTNLSFSVANGGNGEFTIELWAFEYYDFTDSGLIAEGYGNGGEEFALDLGSGSAHDLRFYVRNAAGASYGAASQFAPVAGWTYIAAVCDQANGHLYLYVDGTNIATTVIPAGTGILAETTPLSIGARQSGQNTPFDDQFIGDLGQVALYNKALTPAQIQAHFDATGVGPAVQVIPNSVSTNQGATVTFLASATGSAPLYYQWTDNNGNPVGTNGPALTVTDLQPSQSGGYTVTVTNAYGQAQASVFLSVGSGPPVITSDVSPLNQTVDLYAGLDNVTFSVGVSGSQPFSYQWYKNGQVISGATGSSYSFTALAGTNTYYVTISNSQSSGTPTVSSTATVVGVAPPSLVAANYPNKLKINFPGYQGVPLTNFPALITLSASTPGFSYSGFATGNGADLRFTDASGTAELPYEIDEWNPGGTSTVWVQLPLLNGSNIWAYWGNASDTNAQTWSTDGQVWTPEGYQIVYHLKESSLPFADSTGQHPATNGIAPSPGPGVVGHGAVFNGTNYLSPGQITLSNQFTLYDWVNVDPENQIQTLWANAVGGYGQNGFALFINAYNTDDGAVLVGSGDEPIGGSGAQPQSANNAVVPSSWHLIEATFDAPAGEVAVYVDDQVVISNTLVSDLGLTNTLDLGSFLLQAFPFNGTMDEARVQFGVASPAWLAATYANMADNASFIGFSSGPALTITQSGSTFEISWPATSGSVQLVTTTSLTPPITWTPVNITPTLVNGQEVVQVQAQAGVGHFYALQSQ